MSEPNTDDFIIEDEPLDVVTISHPEALRDLPLVKEILAASLPPGRVAELRITHGRHCCDDPRSIDQLLGFVPGEELDEEQIVAELDALHPDPGSMEPYDDELPDADDPAGWPA